MIQKKRHETRLTVKKSGGKGYESSWIYVPSKMIKDNLFPFDKDDTLTVEVDNDTLVIRKKKVLVDSILKFGFKNAILSKLIETKALENPRKIFLFFKDEKFSYHKTNINSNRVAHGILNVLDKMNRKKCNISLMLPNSPQYIFCWFGIVKAGCVFVPLNSFFKNELLKQAIEKSNSEILIIHYNYLERIEPILNGLKKIKKFIIIGAPNSFNFKKKYVDYQAFLSNKTTNPDLNIKQYHPMTIYFSTRFTKELKAIEFTNFYILSSLITSKKLEDVGFTSSDNIYIPMPIHDISTQLLFVISAMFLNASITLSEEFNPSSFWEDVKKSKAKLFPFSGGMLSSLLNQRPNQKDRSHPIKWAIGPKIPDHTWKAFEKRFGIKIHTFWGRERSIMVTYNSSGSEEGKIGSVGRPIDIFDIKIVDITNRKTLLPGSNNIGEILYKLKLPEFLEESVIVEENRYLKERWLESGDVGYLDNDGYLYFIGTREDLIQKKTETIYMQEIEEVANNHPFIFESAAFLVPNEDLGSEDMKICVVLKDNKTISLDEFVQFLQEKLAYFMVPRYIEFMEYLRMDITENINKLILREDHDRIEVKQKTWDSKTRSFLVD